MNFAWTNPTQVFFGQGVVKQHMKSYIAPKSKVCCIFGGGSIDRNGSRSDVQEALDALECETHWHGGVEANPEYETLLKILPDIRKINPDWLIAIGGGSVIDSTKFLSLASKLSEDVEPWRIFSESIFPDSRIPVCAISTLPASGSEWNPNFCVDRRATHQKVGNRTQLSYPVLTLLDPRYCTTLPVRQLRNGVFDSICHCLDKYLTSEEHPMADDMYIATVKELVKIGPDVIKEDASIELRGRLIIASEYAMNGFLQLTVIPCFALHAIALTLTIYYGIDHGATLSIIAIPFYKNQLEKRKVLMAKTAEAVWNERDGTIEDRAKAYINHLDEFIATLGLPRKVSEWPGVTVKPGDVEALTDLVMKPHNDKPIGRLQTVTREDVRSILAECIC